MSEHYLLEFLLIVSVEKVRDTLRSAQVRGKMRRNEAVSLLSQCLTDATESNCQQRQVLAILTKQLISSSWLYFRKRIGC